MAAPEVLPLRQDPSDAFHALQGVVRRLLESGRFVKSAAVKPALQGATDPPFDETVYGFRNFREFLRAAESEGFVVLRSSSSGPDVDVFPPDRASSSPPHERKTIRNDVWIAFTRWGEGRLRFWDRTAGRAHSVSVDPSAEDSAADASARAAWRADPSRFVEITPIAAGQVVRWMRDFAAALGDEARDALVAALEDERPIRAFTFSVRQLGLGGKWHDYHRDRVTEVVRQWSSEHSLDIDLSPEAEPPAASAPVARIGTDALVMDEQELRKVIITFVSEMTVPELLQIPIPLRLALRNR